MVCRAYRRQQYLVAVLVLLKRFGNRRVWRQHYCCKCSGNKAYRADWANKEMYFREARAFFDNELSMKVVTAQLADILKRMGVS